MQMTLLIRLVLMAALLPCVARAQTPSGGSGFVVGARGEILTTAHVVTGCAGVDIQSWASPAEAAVVVATDAEDDLAIVRLAAGGRAAAVFRAGPQVRIDDTVVAVGYPLAGQLPTPAVLSVGKVSGLTGLNDDYRYLQISAPVQSGTSGGPLLDANGHVVGIVVARADLLRDRGSTGEIPQNVNFALAAEIVRAFLDTNGIDYRSAPSDRQMSAADVGDDARAVTVQVECRQPGSDTGAAAGETLPAGSPQEQYNYAFGLLREQKWPEAEEALRAFVERYPDDVLAGNAQYWLGETFYVRQDYAAAASVFAAGYQKYPTGGKAADNLMKLGMALAQLGQKADACRVFAKFSRDFFIAPTAVKERVRDEKKRLGC
jgi:tol-pal system protein YbgF